MRALTAAAAYFAAVFGAGFVLGVARTLWLVPRIGARAAELAEVPVMLVFVVFAARRVVRRFAVPPAAGPRLAVGVAAVALLLAAELALVLPLRGVTIATYFATRDPVAGAAYLASLVVMALAPLAVARRSRRSPPAGRVRQRRRSPKIAAPRPPAGAPMDTALVIVDIQNDYFPGGQMTLEGSVEAAENAGRLLAAFRERGLPVFHVRHLSTRPGATFFVPGTPGADIHPAVAPRAGEPVLQKSFPNAFRGTTLHEDLGRAGAKKLVIAGMMTHMCIDTTVRAAFDLGYACRLAHDACATRALAFGGETVPAREVHRSFVAALHGLFCTAAGTAEIAAAP